MTVRERGIDAVVFDMDGVLIDTEPVWRRVEMAIFNRLGCALTEADMTAMMGVPILDVVRHWKRQRPWNEPGAEAVAGEIVAGMIAEISAHGAPMRGVHQALAAVHEAGLPIAIASSSSGRMIRAVLDRLQIADQIDVVCTADDEIAGKPDPAVFMRAAERLGVAPERCLAVEDSPNGVRAALAARMICAVVPDPGHSGHEAIAAAHVRWDSLEEMTVAWLREMGPSPGSRIRQGAP